MFESDSGVLLVLGLLSVAVYAYLFALYIFKALGLYRISKQRRYKSAWIAFIPFASDYLLGAITDNINACYGIRSKRRTLLLALSISSAVLFTFTGVFAQESSISYYSDSSMVESPDLRNALIAIVYLASCITMMVFTYISLYKVYDDYNKNNATMFTVLSILFGLAPFFIFSIRNKPSMSLYYANQRIRESKGLTPESMPYSFRPPMDGQYQSPMNDRYQQPPMGGQYQSPMNDRYQQPPMGGQYQTPVNDQYQPLTQPIPPQYSNPVAPPTAPPIDVQNEVNKGKEEPPIE